MRLYYHQPEDGFTDREAVIVLSCLVAVWWAVVHVLDWITFDIIPWWAEPLTFFVVVPFLFIVAELGANPLMWWPLFWGTKIKHRGNDFMAVWRKEEAYLKYGGPKNVYYNGEYIKFRKKRDAFNYCITYNNL